MDGARATLLTGYGGFNVSILPSFDNTAVLWAEQGGVYAVPNLRGGAEFVESWHRAGMQNNKQNVFDDFIAAAEWLVKNNVTSAEKLGIEGGSNGGLLVGAAMTQRPDLWKAVVCSYPLLDMVRYHKFMQGPQWISEYGSADSVVHFKALYAYSPYHHVRQGTKYPATLFVTGDADTRVAPLHARKMTALLQSVVRNESPILLHYDTVGGHSSGTSTSKSIQDEGRILSFLFWQLGVQVTAK
jgi:prolyl oligopeptidase